MARVLWGLLQTHAFLKSAVRQYGARMATPHARQLKDRELSAFRDILAYQSADPRVTLTQLRFLLSCLEDVLPESEAGARLRAACSSQRERLKRQLEREGEAATPSNPQDYRTLDSLSDRVGIFDREYRYKFTNAANLRFHAATLPAFVDRPSWDVTGARFFEEANKPRFDACFAGRTVQCVSAHPNRDPAKIYAATYSPIRAEDGEIRFIMVVSREVSHLPIPKELIDPAP